MMDIEKLRKDLLENSDPDGPCIEDDLMQAAATALSTLQAENEEMQKHLNEFSEFLCHMTGGLLSKTNYTAQEMISAAEDYQQKVCGECDLQAENEKLRAELEQMAACVYYKAGGLCRYGGDDPANICVLGPCPNERTVQEVLAELEQVKRCIEIVEKQRDAAIEELEKYMVQDLLDGNEPCGICAKASDTPCEYCDPKWRGQKED